ncbi:hypothetical protein FPV67DRAFT_1452065 [Lyophyllum atratum]|nr:hypothetical protein FPV67DRAFT_1460529 [Lyophyllum atratum]KAF8057455.1 hypothetical protein FPV67DRAFT_1456083 [Lyophyllum atratum]KAF8063641.1 hypothetical protein FPV67DRAFT_1452065 [Lyophyllum atratum]
MKPARLPAGFSTRESRNKHLRERLVLHGIVAGFSWLACYLLVEFTNRCKGRDYIEMCTLMFTPWRTKKYKLSYIFDRRIQVRVDMTESKKAKLENIRRDRIYTPDAHRHRTTPNVSAQAVAVHLVPACQKARLQSKLSNPSIAHFARPDDFEWMEAGHARRHA